MATKNLLVGTIDFGTTYSGWAFSFLYDFESDPTKASVKQWHSGSGTLTTEKAPTCVLIKPDGKTLEAFGYHAENKYRELTDAGNHKSYYYFKRFKMMLHKKLGEKLDRNMTLEDEMGRSLLALDVFAMTIKYLMDDMLLDCDKRLSGTIQGSEIYWVLTVPAIWTDGAKQFMREAAIKAGVESKKLSIALEPEAASIFCRYLSVETSVDKRDISISQFKAGTRYMILDAGGGTIDITVHEVDKVGGVKEVHAASGGGWGGTMVDKAFEQMLLDIFGQRLYEKFKTDETEDWLDLWRDFEVKKRAVDPEKKGRINMKFPLSLLDTYKSSTGNSVSEAIANSKYRGEIEQSSDKLKFSAKVYQSFFDESIQNTIQHTRGILQDRSVKAILMVGGYSESPMLQHAVKCAFPGIDVIIPLGAASTILRGALIYGHRPKSITERMLKFTYGIRCKREFKEGEDPETHRRLVEGVYYCREVFDKHVEKNEVVKVGEAQVKQSYTPTVKYEKEIIFQVYASDLKNPKYTDQGCTYIGNLKVTVDNPDDDLRRKMLVSLTFSGTEIIIKAEDQKSGKQYSAAVDFLG